VGIKGKEKFIANLEFTANQGKGVLTTHSITLNVDSPNKHSLYFVDCFSYSTVALVVVVVEFLIFALIVE
jgi:invasion protein IalB